MSEKDQLDDFLREKLSEREFPFQEAYWESAQALIEADEQHRRRWFVVWLNSMGLLLAGAGLIALVWWGVSATTQTDWASIRHIRHTDTQWIAQAHPEHETVLMSGVSIPNSLPLQTPSNSRDQNKQETATLSGVREETGKIAATNPLPLQTPSNSRDQNKQETATLSGAREETGEIAATNPLPLQTPSNSRDQNKQETATLSGAREETGEIAAANPLPLHTPSNSREQNKQETATLSEVRGETGEIAIPNAQTLQTTSLKENRQETTSLSEVSGETGKIAGTNSQTLQLSAKALEQNKIETAPLSAVSGEIGEIAVASPQVNQTTPFSLEQHDISLETERLAPKNTQALRVATLSVIEQYEMPSLEVQPNQMQVSLFPQSSDRNKKGRHTLGISLGMSLSDAWPEAEASATPGVLATAFPGMYYQYNMARGITLSTGLRYQSRSGLNVSHTYRSTAFSFGLDEKITTISPQSLHSLEVPIQIGIPLVGQHRLLLGADVAYLLNVESELETVSRDPFGTETRSKETGWGYTQGFKPFDIGIQAGYRYRIGRRMQVGMSLRYGLRDLTDDSFFDQNAVNRNVQIRLVWEQDLFRF